jgi:catechol 2,3-dioxygenase-like lactoylglutathione lyase family enzyme
MMPPLDHLTILSRDPARSAAWYGLLLPLLGFEQARPHIWRRADGLYVQFGPARPDTRPYERHGAGMNHIGFRAPDVAFVEQVAAIMLDAGHEARLQRFKDGTVALFLPDPDGFRVEVSWYPPGTPPVD